MRRCKIDGTVCTFPIVCKFQLLLHPLKFEGHSRDGSGNYRSCLDNRRINRMNDKDILFIMTICELMGKSTSVHSVELAYQNAERNLEKKKKLKKQSKPADWD
jgi:hypothetical protein